MKHIILVIQIIFIFLLTSCGGGGGGSSTQSIADAAAKSAPWSEVPISDSISLEDKEYILSEVDYIMASINSNAFQSQKKGDTENIDVEFDGEYGGKVIFKTVATIDSDEEDDPFLAHENGSYDFQGFEDSNISIHGKATYSLKYTQSGEFGEDLTVVTTIDSGFSCFYNSKHYKLTMKWVNTLHDHSFSYTQEIKGTVNGTQITIEQ